MRQDIDRKALKHALLGRQQALLAASEGRAEESAPKELDQSRVGRLSRMDAMQQQAMSQAAARRAGEELQRISSALARIDTDEYGYCNLCDEEIAVKRLQFDPSILTCIDCAKRAEKEG